MHLRKIRTPRRRGQMTNRALADPTPTLMIPRRTLIKAARLAATATIIRPAFADSELDSLYAKARKEGGLNLYGGGPADWYAQWAKQFEAALPFKEDGEAEGAENGRAVR